MVKLKEIDVYKYKIKTDYGEMVADSMSNDINVVRRELKDNYGYGADRIKSIKLLKRKVKGLVRL